jgi:tryptophanyl-tRNA synthetase
MIADDEKMFRDGIGADTMSANVAATLAQLEKIGFSATNTRFRINSHGLSRAEYALMIRIMSLVNVHTLNSIFGEKTNVGEYFYPLIQLLPCFMGAAATASAKCIVIAGIDQDPFFRLARSVAQRLGYPQPVVLYTQSVPGLDGSPKMSTSVPESLPIFLNDGPKVIAEKVAKIKKVGAGSLDELFCNGANLTIDIPYKLIKIFDTNNENVALIEAAYTAGLTEKAQLEGIIPVKGFAERGGKYMLTSHGIRLYLTSLLVRMLTT